MNKNSWYEVDKKGLADSRCSVQKGPKSRGVEQVDMFATDEKEDNNTISQGE